MLIATVDKLMLKTYPGVCVISADPPRKRIDAVQLNGQPRWGHLFSLINHTMTHLTISFRKQKSYSIFYPVYLIVLYKGHFSK